MTKQYSVNVLVLLEELYKIGPEPDSVSPNYVASFAYENKVVCSSAEIVQVSDLYGTRQCPVNPNFEF